MRMFTHTIRLNEPAPVTYSYRLGNGLHNRPAGGKWKISVSSSRLRSVSARTKNITISVSPRKSNDLDGRTPPN